MTCRWLIVELAMQVQKPTRIVYPSDLLRPEFVILIANRQERESAPDGRGEVGRF